MTDPDDRPPDSVTFLRSIIPVAGLGVITLAVPIAPSWPQRSADQSDRIRASLTV